MRIIQLRGYLGLRVSVRLTCNASAAMRLTIQDVPQRIEDHRASAEAFKSSSSLWDGTYVSRVAST